MKLENFWPLLVALGATVFGWFLLAGVSVDARGAECRASKTPAECAKEADGTSLTTADYAKAGEWAKALLGLAATLAGFLGIAAAAQKSSGLGVTERAQTATGGAAGMLAGMTLLGVGEWYVPVALAVLLGGATTMGVASGLRGLREGALVADHLQGLADRVEAVEKKLPTAKTG